MNEEGRVWTVSCNDMQGPFPQNVFVHSYAKCISYARVHPNTQIHQIRNDLNADYSYRNANQNLYEVFQIRPVKQTLLFGIKKRGWCYIVEDTYKAGAFRIHLVQYVT